VSAHIGTVGTQGYRFSVRVSASTGGVEVAEVFGDDRDRDDVRLDPIQARNLAALLVRASEEVERMRAPADRERSRIRVGDALLGMRVRLDGEKGEGEIVQIHFGAVEVDWGDGRITTVKQNSVGNLGGLLRSAVRSRQ